MSKKETCPFKPYITTEQILAYDATKPETSTGSPFVDTVLSLFSDPEYGMVTTICRHLALDPHDISGYLFIATGHRLTELRRLWMAHRLEEEKRRHPYYTEDELARALGYKDHSSLWHFMHAEEQDRRQTAHRHEISERAMHHS